MIVLPKSLWPNELSHAAISNQELHKIQPMGLFIKSDYRMQSYHAMTLNQVLHRRKLKVLVFTMFLFHRIRSMGNNWNMIKIVKF